MLGVFNRPSLPAVGVLALLLHLLLWLGLPWSHLSKPHVLPSAQRNAPASRFVTRVLPAPMPPPEPLKEDAATPLRPARPGAVAAPTRGAAAAAPLDATAPSEASEPQDSTAPSSASHAAVLTAANAHTNAHAEATPQAEVTLHLPRPLVGALQPFRAQGHLTRAGRSAPVAVTWYASAVPTAGADRYQASVHSQESEAGAPAVHWNSEGQWGLRGAVPERFVSTGRRGAAQAVNFQRDRQRIGFSGPTIERPWVEGVQDRLSLWMQMQAELAALGPDAAVRAPWVFWVVGIQGDARAWSFEARWVSPGSGLTERALRDERGGAPSLLRLVHRASARYDLEMELDWAWTPVPRLVAARWWHRGVADALWELTLSPETP